MLPPNTFVVIGPESTGKTTLCQQLASRYQSDWIPEYARTYLEELQKPYTFDDVIHIAQKQIEIEQNFSGQSNFLFIDTDLIITKVWLLHVFKQTPPWIDDYLKSAYRKAYLITYPDLPWEFDPLRENPHLRQYLFDWYIREVKQLNTPYAIIKGLGNERTENAVKYIQSIIDI